MSKSLHSSQGAHHLWVSPKCAALISERLRVSIPDNIVSAEVKRAIAYLDIVEAYIYRDWQAAIGDLMLERLANASRRFDVIGFGEFESKYLAAKVTTECPDKLWFDRLESLFLGLDMRQDGVFDARRKQVRRVYSAVSDLEAALRKRLDERKQLQ